MVKDTGLPVQPCGLVGVTVTVPTSGLLTLAAVKEMFPVPEAGSPIAGLELVH